MISSFPMTKFRITKKYLVVIVDNGCHKNVDIENVDIGDFSLKNVLCSRMFKYFWDILHLVHFSSSDSYIPRELIWQVTEGARDLRNLRSASEVWLFLTVTVFITVKNRDRHGISEISWPSSNFWQNFVTVKKSSTPYFDTLEPRTFLVHSSVEKDDLKIVRLTFTNTELKIEVDVPDIGVDTLKSIDSKFSMSLDFELDSWNFVYR